MNGDLDGVCKRKSAKNFFVGVEEPDFAASGDVEADGVIERDFVGDGFPC